MMKLAEKDKKVWEIRWQNSPLRYVYIYVREERWAKNHEISSRLTDSFSLPSSFSWLQFPSLHFSVMSYEL